MDEQNFQKSLELSLAILKCPHGDVERLQKQLDLIQDLIQQTNKEDICSILNTNFDLVDVDLTQKMLQVAEWNQFSGNDAIATFLIELTEEIEKVLYQNFCQEMFEAENRGGQSAVFDILIKNLSLLKKELGDSLVKASKHLTETNDRIYHEYIIKCTENICNYLLLFPLGDPLGKFLSAIIGYRYILSLNNTNSIKTAQIKNNLGGAYTYLAEYSKNPKQEIENAILCYQEALNVRTEITLPKDFAQTQNNLGLAYFHLASCSESPQRELRKAIVCYDNALRVYTEVETPQDWAMVRNNLAIAYQALASYLDAPRQEIKNAITFYREALKVYTEEKYPQDFVMTQNNLGEAYRMLASYSEKPKCELENAITCYQSTLSVYNKVELPEYWIKTQMHLGNAYLSLIRYSETPKMDIEKAISYYCNALQRCRETEFPKFWIGIQVNLSNCYFNLAKYSANPQNEIEQAITSCYAALQICNETEQPLIWATAYNNLGNAYIKLASYSETPQKEFEHAITSYCRALQVFNEVQTPQDWAKAQINLGNTHLYLASYSETSKSDIEQAITLYCQALRIFNEAKMPQEWAMIQNNLGNAYRSLSLYSENPQNELEQAINFHLAAFRIRTESKLPQDWADNQNNLGVVYTLLAQYSENPKQEINLAISCYQASLRVRKSTLLSLDCLQTGRNLGSLGFQEGMWEIAFEGYSQAIEAVENIRSWATNDDRRAEIHAQSIEIYTNIVQALINLERYEEAIEYAERSRSQRIVDLLHTKDVYPQGNISETVKQKLAEFHAKQKAIDILQRQLDSKQNQSDRGQPNQRDLTEYQLAQLKQLQTEKQEIWNSLRSDDPILAGQVKVDPLPFAKMQELIKDKTDTAILYFYFTRNALLVFIVLSDQISLHQCPEQNIDNLNNFLFENWLKVYQTDSSLWRKQMPKILGEIAQRLNLNQLIQIHIPDRIKELIIVPHLYLHQIPFAALPISNSPRLAGEGQGVRAEYLSDRYRLRTISSLQILSYCHSRPVIANPTYATIENAQDNLPFAGFEGEQVAEMFQVPSDRRLIGKKAATTDNYRRLLESANSLLSAHHAASRIDTPLESKLQLGDGFISLGELMMSRYSDISEIFLSCCETGLGAPQNLTDDILTLATGFLCAGARTVISSLWTVDDLATALFSMFYHQNIKAGSDRPTALYQAQSRIRQLQDGELNEGQPIRQKLDRYFEQQIQLLRDYLKNSKSKHLYQAAIEAKTLEVGKIKSLIYQSAQQAHPFNHPFYWSSFIAQGES